MLRNSILALALVASSVQAQVIPNDVRAPVNVAAALFAGCFQAELGDVTFPKNKAGIKAILDQIDTDCISWAFIWTKPLTDSDPILWPMDNLQRFDAIRFRLVTDVNAQILHQMKLK